MTDLEEIVGISLPSLLDLAETREEVFNGCRIVVCCGFLIPPVSDCKNSNACRFLLSLSLCEDGSGVVAVVVDRENLTRGAGSLPLAVVAVLSDL